jgi:hypothetical protein
LWIQQQGLCWICGKPMIRFGNPQARKAVSRDHIVPSCLGGRGEGNFLLAHRQCNTDRGSPFVENARQVMDAAFLKLQCSELWNDNYVDEANGQYYKRNPQPVTVAEDKPISKRAQKRRDSKARKRQFAITFEKENAMPFHQWKAMHLEKTYSNGTKVYIPDDGIPDPQFECN